MTAIPGIENIKVAQFLAQYHALKLEALGLKRRGSSVLRLLKASENLKARTAKDALVELEPKYKKLTGRA